MVDEQRLRAQLDQLRGAEELQVNRRDLAEEEDVEARERRIALYEDAKVRPASGRIATERIRVLVRSRVRRCRAAGTRA